MDNVDVVYRAVISHDNFEVVFPWWLLHWTSYWRPVSWHPEQLGVRCPAQGHIHSSPLSPLNPYLETQTAPGSPDKLLYLNSLPRSGALPTELLKNKYTEDDIVHMVNILVDNIFVKFGGRIFQQTIRIPMGADCTPLFIMAKRK